MPTKLPALGFKNNLYPDAGYPFHTKSSIQPTPVRSGNGKNTPDDDLLLLKEYERLKQELIKE